jgi:hypothetical protein
VWLQEEGAICRYFEELLSSSAAPDPRRTYGRDHLSIGIPPGKQAVHDLSAARDDRADLLAIDEFGGGRAAMADEAGDLLDRDARAESSETKLCRSSRGAHSAGSRPAAAMTLRNERRTLAASSAVPAPEANTRSLSCHLSPASSRARSSG